MFNELYEIYERIGCYFYEASPIYKAKEKTLSLAKPIFCHILKIAYLFKEDNNTNLHWASEIQNWLVQCMKTKLKKTHNYPTKKQIIEWLFEDYNKPEDLFTQSMEIFNEYNIKINQEKSLNFL